MSHDVRDVNFAAEGLRRIKWAEREMPVLRRIKERFQIEDRSEDMPAMPTPEEIGVAL